MGAPGSRTCARAVGCTSACAATLVRNASARRRGGPAGNSGAARPRNHLDDSGLHSGRVGAAEIGICAGASSGLTPDFWERELETNVKAVELQDLWRRYKSSGDERARCRQRQGHRQKVPTCHAPQRAFHRLRSTEENRPVAGNRRTWSDAAQKSGSRGRCPLAANTRRPAISLR